VTMFVLVRLPEEDEETYRQVSEEVLARIPFSEAILPSEIAWNSDTPWILTVQGGQVVAVHGARE